MLLMFLSALIKRNKARKTAKETVEWLQKKVDAPLSPARRGSGGSSASSSPRRTSSYGSISTGTRRRSASAEALPPQLRTRRAAVDAAAARGTERRCHFRG